MYEYKVTLDRVVDGDTVDVHIDLGFDVVLKSQRVRISGIDAPESRTRDLVEKQFGLLAKDVVIAFFETDKPIKLVCKEYDSAGKYGRILGDFVCGEISLAEYMVTEGYAVRYHGQSKEDVEMKHLENRDKLISDGIITLK